MQVGANTVPMNFVQEIKQARQLLFLPSHHTQWFYIISIGMALVSFLTSSIVGAADVRLNPHISSREIWIGEATSHFAIILLLPLFPIALERFGGPSIQWRNLAVAGVASLISFWLLHVALMFGLRAVVWPLVMGQLYPVNLFSTANLTYEFSKDIFTFGLLAFAFTTTRAFFFKAEQARAPSSPTDKITLKSGSATHFVSPNDIISASAASNYVEIKLEAQTILVRISLSRLAALLSNSENMVQIHRSHPVNKTKIKSIAARGDGGFRVVMNDGSELPGSRRYRQTLQAETI